MSFRQTAPPAQQQQQQQQPQPGQNETPRQVQQVLARGPSTQSPARKPLQSGARPGQASQASSVHGGSVHGGSDNSKGSPSISSVHMATATASPIEHSRRPSQQLGQQLSLQQTNSPLAQPPQLANQQQQPFQRVPLPGQPPAGHQGPNPQASFPSQAPQPGPQPGQAQGGPPGQIPQNQQGMRPAGQQQQGPPGTPASGQQGQPYNTPQRPWAVGTSGPVPHQGQAGPFFQAHPPNNGADKEPKGTISKFINKAKEVTKEVTSSASSHDKADKEKGGKSRFGFLRSKPPEQRQQQPPPLRGGPQFTSPPGRPVMPQESQIERLQQLQSQVSPSEAQPQPRPSPTPSPGPHLNYQHQRQSPPNGTSPQVAPATGSKTPSPRPQQALSPVQGSPSGPSPQQQSPRVVQQQGAPRLQQGAPGQGPPPGPQGRTQFTQFGQMPKPLNQRPAPGPQQPNEPRYGQVPIPTGYGKVHSEGRIEPAPVAYYMGPHGQFLPVQSGTPGSQPQVQPWIQPGMAQRHPSWQQQQQPGQGGQPPHLQTQQPITRVAVVSPNAATPGFPAGGTHPHPTDPVHPLHVQNPDQQAARGLVPTPQGETPQATPLASAVSPMPDAQVQTYSAPARNDAPSRPEPERFQTAMSSPGDAATPPPQVQHPGSPQSYPLPDTAFSPVNPNAARAGTPPLPSPLPNSDLVPSPLRPNSMLLQTAAVPQRQVSAASQVLSLQPDNNSTPRQAHTTAGAEFAVDSGYLQVRSPSPQVTPEHNISPEPPAALSPQPQMHINVQQANENGHVEEQDNIYDATPRTETSPVQHRLQEQTMSPPAEEPAEPKAGGTGHEVLEHRDQHPEQHLEQHLEQPHEQHPEQQPQPQLPSASPPQHLVINTHTSPTPSPPPVAQPAPVHQPVVEPTTTSTPLPANDAATTTAVTNGTTSISPPPPSSRSTPPAAVPSNNPVDIFEEAKRKAVLRDMEEKIPVFPTEPDMNSQALAELAAKKKAEEERPQMSATSYPGQEWNPYGEGWVDEE
ncbi:hypothetical protein GE09DRAFT_1129605 [Coniochaeta sp. 2T2.1]|nr:hypothetical protein GE09DRAFT_1129605 [Coniochaeta sp. 2T2.1]